ncbi:conserved Plasmodium protein, unknown function [Plasmodium relictum]|uniref:Uncharacterized protein n=1 Tax=Plasmodium relictum TaxID=85471 RepID=A0A1J1HBC8_PLARL|nr:conserved Plasmodium protein, unknown function [Plasmodium relictum]CRH00730.1 conserved Plasmodium protein, unknown function [Plasmodium relictum]
MKKRSYNLNNLKIVGDTLSKKKNRSLYNFSSNYELNYNKKKRLKCNDFDHLGEEKYDNEIFSKLKDFYKNSHNLSCKNNPKNDYRKNKRKEREFKDEILIKEKRKVYTNKIYNLSKSDVSDEDIRIIERKCFIKKRKNFLHENLYSKSENNSKVKYKIRRKNNQYAEIDLYKKNNFSENCIIDVKKKKLECLKEEIKKKEKDNEVEELLKKENNKYDKSNNCEKSIKNEEIKCLIYNENEKFSKEENKNNQENEKFSKEENKNKGNEKFSKEENENNQENRKHREQRKYEKLREQIKLKQCESTFVSNNLNYNERFFDKYVEKSIKKNEENLKLEIKDFKDETNNKINNNKNKSDKYMNYNDITFYKSNNHIIENERTNGENNFFNCCSSEDKIYEEMEEYLTNNKNYMDVHDKLKEKIINFSEDPYSSSNLNLLNLSNKLTLYDKETILPNDNINNGNNTNNSAANKYNSNNSVQNVDNNNNIKDKIIEKKKKIKSIHNEILNLMNEDNINKNEITNEEKSSLVNKNVREKKKETDQYFIFKDNKSTYCNLLNINNKNKNNEKINNNKKYINSIYKNNLGNKAYDENEKKYYNAISFFDYEDFSSNRLFLSKKKEENLKKCAMNNKKKETSILESKKEYIKNIKLIYEREKKILDVNVKFIEKYSYFKIILNTYSENHLIKMNEHINFKLSKVLFSNKMIDKINKNNFKKIMKALDFYGYLYNNTFLKNLCNKITINNWLGNRKFFHEIFGKKILKIGIFYDLVYHFLYLNNTFLEFFFTKKGGHFMKTFLLYDKNKAVKLINKIVKDLKNINPSTNSVANFLYGFFIGENKKKKLKKIRNHIKDQHQHNEYMHLKSNSINIKKNKNISGENFCELNKKVKDNCIYSKKKQDAYIYIKNSKYKKKVLRSILNKIWLNTDLYIKEEIYYDQNFTKKKKLKKNKINNLKKLNNLLYDINDSSESSVYSFLTDEERQYNFYKSDENNLNLNEQLNETFHQCIYNEEIDDDPIIQHHDSHENNQPNDYENNEEENVEIETNSNNNNNNNIIENSIKTFQTLDCIPNISFDLYSENNNYHQKGNSFLSLCFKEEEKCNIDKYIKDVSFLGIRISSKENKINYFNCFDVNLKIKIKNHLLSNINYNISKDDENISAFLPVWPNNPDYFGFKVGKNIKKEFNEIKRNIMQEKGEKKKKSWDIIINKMSSRLMKFDESKKIFDKENKMENNFDFSKSYISNNDIDKNKITNIDEVKIKDCNFFLNIKMYPIRTLTLYILYNSIYKDKNLNFVEFFSNSINNEIKEWLLLFLLPNFINKCIHKVTFPLKLTKNIFTESNEFYEDFFSNEYLKINDIEKIIIYSKNNSEEEIEICPFFFCYKWLKSSKYKIDRWISSKINEIFFTFPYANFLMSKYFSNFLLFIQLFQSSLDIDHMYLCKSHFYVSLKHNISFLHESIVNVLFSSLGKLKNV